MDQNNNKMYSDEKTISYFNYINRYPQNFSGLSASLIIIDRDRIIKTISLEGDNVTIGKSGDIKIASAIITHIHGRFIKKDGDYYYIDEGSTNGSELNGKQIRKSVGVRSAPVCLGDGDIIRVMVPDEPSNIENVLIIFSRQPVADNWKYIDLVKQPPYFDIGRSVQGTGLRIDSVQASRLHARIIRTPQGYCISDENSLNGVTVNGSRIVSFYILNDFDVICIASMKIIFLRNSLIFNSASSGVRLEVRDISKVVRGLKKPILNHISLTINPGELVAVIGGSGAGKTTFINCLNGYEPATSGNVLIDGTDLIQNYKNLKSKIGNVPQSDELYDYLTIYDFLSFTAKLRLPSDISKNERHERVNTVLDIMGLKEHQKKLIKKLSGGQKKRVSIAMELVSDPDIFFLDEPTSGLDPETETQLMKQLKRLSSDYNKTIVVITHTLQNIHLFDRIIFLASGGRLCFYGSPVNALRFFEIQSISDAYEKVEKNADYFIDKYRNYYRGE